MKKISVPITTFISFTVVLTFYVTSCDYHQDKLLIQNNTKGLICCEILIKNKINGIYNEVAANLEINAHKSEHPILRSPISTELKNNSADSVLYIVVHDCDDKEYVFKNIGSVVLDKRFILGKYSKNILDSLNWVVKYNGQ